ncbi:MAG: TonB-dependent receptor, partial [Prolixibacteraceae bacterium]|nr:TonB-dependent receptor [Prolixibacteraceae bacterium]
PGEHCKVFTFIHPNFKKLTINRVDLEAQQYVVILEQKLLLLDEVTIHPHLRGLSSNESSQTISLLTPEAVQLFQPQTTADLLGTSSEVFIQKSQMGGGSPMLRGFSANRILLVVDGVRMNNAIYRSGNLHNVIALDASVMEQTEVILGPGSVVYGSDALGGVVHFYTLKPRLSTAAQKTTYNALLRTSSANFEKTVNVHVQHSEKNWSTLTSFTFSDFDDLLMGGRKHDEYRRIHYTQTDGSSDLMVLNPNPERQVQTAYSQMNILQKMRYRPSNRVDLEYAFHYSRSSKVPRYDRLIQYSGDRLKYAEWYYGPQQWIMHSVKASLNPEFNIADRLIMLAAYQDYTESRHDRRFGDSNRYSRTENVDALSLNIDLEKHFSRTSWLYYGFEGVHNLVHSTGQVTNTNTELVQAIVSRYPDNARWWSLASYAMAQHFLSKGHLMQAGLRYNLSGMSGKFDPSVFPFPFDHFQNTTDALTASLGIMINQGASSNITLNASTGFRAPNIDDAAKVFDSEPGTVMVPNPALKPEYAYTFEIGNKLETKHYKHNINLFYTRLTRAMVRRDGQLNGQDSILYEGEMSKVRMLTNASWANLAGVSYNYSWKLVKHLSFKGALNWQTGIDSDGLPLRHVAPLFGNTHLVYQTSKITLDGYVVFNGAIAHRNLAAEERDKVEIYATDTHGNPYAPAWMTLNLKGSYKVNNVLTFNAGLENLLNARYRPYSSGIVAPGLNLVGAIILNF